MFYKEAIFSGFSVRNIQEAKKFYTDVLGLKTFLNSMDVLEIDIPGSNNILVYPKSDHEAAKFTVLNFPVDDIEISVSELIERGVVFEQYDGEIAIDEKGIFRGVSPEPDIAWFRDPAGNIFSILQEK